MFQLPNVAGPGKLRHRLDRGGIQSIDVAPIAGGITTEKMRGKRWNIFATLTQWRHMNLHRVDPEKQVFAELTVCTSGLQIDVCGRDYTHVNMSRPRRP